MGQGIDSIRQEKASCRGFFTSYCERDGARASQAHFSQSSIAAIEEDPLASTIFGDGEIKTASIGMAANLSQRLDFACVQAVDLKALIYSADTSGCLDDQERQSLTKIPYFIASSPMVPNNRG